MWRTCSTFQRSLSQRVQELSTCFQAALPNTRATVRGLPRLQPVWTRQVLPSVQSWTTWRPSVSAYGSCPDGLDGRSAFEAVLKSEDLYVLNRKNLAPYDPDLLKVAKSDVRPKTATQLLPPDAAQPLLDPDRFIVRSDEVMALWHSEHAGFKPYWDPTLAADRGKRV